MNNTNTRNILYVVLLIYVITGAVATCLFLKNLSWDPSLVLKMTDNVYKNIPFNHYAHPMPSNLDKDETEFVTWWSPGQFALPLLIERCFNIKLVSALKILSILCLFASGLGIFKLYRALIENKDADANSQSTTMVLGLLLFTITQPFFFLNFFVYDGGGILMLAYCPWFIYWVIKLNRISLLNLLLLLILAFIGFFLKSAFTSIFAGALFYLFIKNHVPPHTRFKDLNFRKILASVIHLGCIFIIYMMATKILFLDHNTNISNSSTGIRLQPRVIAFPVIAPMIGVFCLNALNKTIYWLICCVIAIPAYYFILKSQNINLLYKYVLVGFAGICITFYSLLYFINVDVSYELRHFTVITILITPAIFLALWRGHLSKYLVLSIAVLYGAFNLFSYTKNITASNKYNGAVGYYTGLALPYPVDVVNKIHALDGLNNTGRDIFYFTNAVPQAALEIKHNRVLLEDNYINFHFVNSGRFNKTLYYGRNSGAVYIVYPLANFKRDSSVYLTRFERYKKFDRIYESKGFVILKAIPDSK